MTALSAKWNKRGNRGGIKLEGNRKGGGKCRVWTESLVTKESGEEEEEEKRRKRLFGFVKGYKK